MSCDYAIHAILNKTYHRSVICPGDTSRKKRLQLPLMIRVLNTVSTRAGTNTPSDEYDSYREYRVANTNMYSRIQ